MVRSNSTLLKITFDSRKILRCSETSSGQEEVRTLATAPKDQWKIKAN
jgi:hypothetical protein